MAAAGHTLTPWRVRDFERRIDLPRAIVWDALLDPVLVEGWLHPTARLLDGDVGERIEPAPGETAVLATALEPFGALRFELDERGGRNARHVDVRSGSAPSDRRTGPTGSTISRTCCADIRGTGATARPSRAPRLSVAARCRAHMSTNTTHMLHAAPGTT